MNVTRYIKTTALVLCLLLAGCSKVDRAHFDQVKDGMTLEQVTTILGTPTTSDTGNILGISTTSAEWKNGNTVIHATFTNDVLILRTFSDGSATTK